MAGILETFGILFDSDAEEVKKGMGEAEGAADSLEGKLTDVDATTTQLGDSFLDLISSAKGAIASILSVGLVSAAVIDTAKTTDEVGKFSDVLGLAVEDVHAWSEAVIRAGGDQGAFQSSVSSLTDSLTDLILTGSGPAVDVLARLGVSAVNASGQFKTAFEILPDIAEAFQRLSDAESVGFGQKLGLDRGTILLLQQGREAVDSLISRQRELGVVTQEDFEIAAKFNDQWADTRQIFNAMSVSAGTSILPTLTSLLKSLEHVVFFLADHKEVVTGFFIGAGAAITTYFLPSIIAAGTAVFAALSPFLLVGGAILAIGAAFGLIYEDIVKFTEGHNSLIGQLINKYPVLGDVIESVGTTIESVISSMTKFGEFIYTLFTEPQKAFDMLLSGLNSLGDSIEGIFNGIADKVPDLGVLADDVVNYFTEKFSGLGYLGEILANIFTLPLRTIDAVVDSVKFFVALIRKEIPDTATLISKSFSALDWIKDFFIDMFSAPLAAINKLKSVFSDFILFVVESLPDISGALESIKDFFSIGDAEIKLHSDIQQSIETKESKDSGIGSFINEFFNNNSEESSETNVINESAIDETTNSLINNISNIDSSLTQIDNNPLNGQSSNAIVNASRNSSVNNSLRIDKVDVNTKATDSKELARSFYDKLNAEMQATVNNFDDGVLT